MYIKEKLGNISEEEKEKLVKLTGRLNSLNELLMINDYNLSSKYENESLRNKITRDKEENENLLESYRRILCERYGWANSENTQLAVKAKTNEVFLVKNIP